MKVFGWMDVRDGRRWMVKIFDRPWAEGRVGRRGYVRVEFTAGQHRFEIDSPLHPEQGEQGLLADLLDCAQGR